MSNGKLRSYGGRVCSADSQSLCERLCWATVRRLCSMVVTLLCAAVVFHGLTFQPVRAADQTDPFPFRVGSYWVFRGPVDSDAGGGKISHTDVNWKMEVLAQTTKGALTVATVKGYPNDLWWYQPATSRGDYFLVKRGGKYFLLDKNSVGDVLKQLVNEKSLDKFLTSDNLILSFPLVVGKGFGQSSPSDTMSGWSVEKAESYSLHYVKGDKHPPASPGYLLTHHDNTCHMAAEFVPGLGFVRELGEHHGTVSKFDVRLVEYHY